MSPGSYKNHFKTLQSKGGHGLSAELQIEDPELYGETILVAYV
jgi:hypothetical protein